MKSCIVAAIAIATFTGVAAEPEIKGTATELAAYIASVRKPVIIVTDGEARAQADKGIITLRVVTEAKGLQAALKANQDAKGKFASFVKDRGVAEELIQGARFSSTPRYGIFSEKARSYRVDNQLKVTIHDDKGFQAVAAAVDAIPEIMYVGIEFESSIKAELKNKAIAQAAEKVLAEKKVYEDKLGVKLLIKQFSTADAAYAGVQRRGYYGQEKYPERSGVTIAGGTPPPVEQGDDSVSVFGEITAKVAISFEFTVESK